jgi:hypothetical protein
MAMRGSPDLTVWRVPASTCKPSPAILRRPGIHLKATEQPIDASTAAGKCFFDMLAAIETSTPPQ